MTTEKTEAQAPERIARFTHTYEDGIWNMDKRPDGKWVRYADHERIVKNLETHIADLNHDLEATIKECNEHHG